MVVKRAYKRTEVGVVPEDWDVVLLDSVARRGSGHTPDKAHPEYWGGEIKWISLQDSDRLDRLYISDTAAKITPVGIANSSARLHPAGTVVLSRDAGVGKSAIMKLDMAVSQHFMAWTCNPPLHNLFLYYWLQKEKPEFERIAMGSTIKTIGLSYFQQLVVPLPTKAEQEAIAEALSDADALIESLEQLVAKKRQLKQGAMQELLTGKRRLPGFRGEWEVRRLDELGRWTGGMTPSMRNEDYWENGTVPWISSGDVKSPRLMSTAFAISEYAVKRRATPLLPAKSIIVVTRSGILRKFLPVSMNMIPMAINQDIKALLPNQRALAEYLLHSLIYNGDQILSRCLKSGTTVESIEFPWLKAFMIPIPPLHEQTAIAALLSDMDAEIAALEAKLAKARQIKQGMMQELLTGRIRLV
jgi:type I restriction enzyme, S subunit